MASQPQAAGSIRRVSVSHRSLMAWRLLSAIMLLVMGGIHLYLVLDGVGGMLGTLFVLNAVGALVLAIAIIVLRGPDPGAFHDAYLTLVLRARLDRNF